MLIGIVGAPNKGKSTLFSALTLNDVAIADYPFTTIDPNKGVAFATVKCPCVSLGLRCGARDGLCVGGTRRIPVNVVDVAGLVEGAHLGRGMGNKFLNDIAGADALILVADASGRTDSAGNAAFGADPAADIEMIRGELAEWLAGIVARHMEQLSRKADGVSALLEVLAGVKVDRASVDGAISDAGLLPGRVGWGEEETRRFASALLSRSKPMLIAANKMDVPGASASLKALSIRFSDVIGISAAVELSLEKAARSRMISWESEREFRVIGSPTKEQANALEYMRRFLKEGGIRASELVNRVVFGLLGYIVVYPVEDENKYTDGNGNVLPDAILMRKGATAHDLANAIHTEIGKGMLYAVDARKKLRISKEHQLQDGDIIKVVSSMRR